jgi:hypothetical protein
MRRTRPCLIECVPAACSYPGYEGSTAVTHVSCHRVTRRSALTELSPLIAALSRGSEVTLQGHRGVSAGGGDSSLNFAARAGGCGRRQAVGDGRHPSPENCGGLAEHLMVLRDMFGRAPPVRIGIPGSAGRSSRCLSDRGGVSDQRRGCCRCNYAWLPLVQLEAV